MRLTEQTIETARYEGKCTVGKGGRKRWSVHILWEEGGSGLGLRISSTGRKSYVVSRRAGGRKRVETLGRVGEMTLREARERAAELRGSPREKAPVADNPAAEPEPEAVARAEAEGAPTTVGELADAYLEQHLKVHTATWFTEQRLIHSRIRPIVGRMPLDRFTRADLAPLRIKFRTLYPRDAARMSKLVTELFAWASAHELWPVGAGGPRAAPPAKTESEAAESAAPRRSAAELAEALAKSEKECDALTLRIQELSESGGEMMDRLSALASVRARLESELASVREGLKNDSGKAWPRAAKDEVSTLRRKVAELTERAERSAEARRELRKRLEEKGRQEESLARELADLGRRRSEQAAELERLRAAAAEPPPQGAAADETSPSGRSWRPKWLAAAATAGAIVGALLTYRVTSGRPPREPAVKEPPRQEAEAPPAPAGLGTPEPAVADVEPALPEPPPAPEPAGPDYGAVEATVRDWATAWSEQRVEQYLAFYAEEFRPPGGSSRGEWEEQRRLRLTKPSSIRVTLGPLRQEILSPERVSVSFDQAYRTESYGDDTRKTLTLAWSDDRWTIVEERAE